MAKVWKTLSLLAFWAGLVTAFVFSCGWMAAATLPLGLTVAAVVLSRFNAGEGTTSYAERYVFWLGVALLIVLVKATYGWPWFLWVVAAVPALFGVSAFLGAANETLTKMFRS